MVRVSVGGPTPATVTRTVLRTPRTSPLTVHPNPHPWSMEVTPGDENGGEDRDSPQGYPKGGVDVFSVDSRAPSRGPDVPESRRMVHSVQADTEFIPTREIGP